MPAKRVILLERDTTGAMRYGYVLWADVPAGNQLAYRNPSATSRHPNVTPAELQAIRDGLVVERSGMYKAASGTPLATMQTNLESQWQAFQSEVTAETKWAEHGRFWDGAAWQASAGVPAARMSDGTAVGTPTYVALTPVSAYGANKFQFVLFNGISTTLGQGLVLRVRTVVILPGLVAVTGAAPSAWVLRRREGLTTAPAGGTVTIVAADTAQPLPAGPSAHQAPTTAPAGGTVSVFTEFVPQADEQKVSTLDAPTMSGLYGGQVVYDAAVVPRGQPITIRAGQALEVQQSAAAGTGNCRVLCVFTVG